MVLKGKVLVANTGDDTLTFINLENNKREVLDLKEIIRLNNRKTIRLEGSFIGPYDIVINKEGYVYCTNVYDNSIFKIDLKKKKIVEILAVGSYPTCIKYFNKCLFITNTDSNSISIIDEEKFSLIENIPVGEKPTDIEVDKKNMNLYVVNSNGYSIDLISLEK
ncbi:YncE family protein, partial [Schnuerera sp.]|uniref:YncE family protein n=1 Tax=Schnuerera sp. TaxID=2794844 RepID=UPI002C8E3DC5